MHVCCMHAAAVEDFSKAIELQPQYADCWKRRGQARSAMGEHEAALQARPAVCLSKQFCPSFPINRFSRVCPEGR